MRINRDEHPLDVLHELQHRMRAAEVFGRSLLEAAGKGTGIDYQAEGAAGALVAIAEDFEDAQEAIKHWIRIHHPGTMETR